MIQKIFLAVIAIAVLAFICWLKGWWIPNRPDPDKYPIRGIDVSHHNGAINWAYVFWENANTNWENCDSKWEG